MFKYFKIKVSKSYEYFLPRRIYSKLQTNLHLNIIKLQEIQNMKVTHLSILFNN